MKRHYTTAVVELITSGMEFDTVLANLKVVLQRLGHTRLLKDILESIPTALLTLEQKQIPVVVVAKEEHATALSIKAALADLGAPEVSPRVIIDDTIIGGSIVSFNHQVLDQSYKTKLRKIYQSTITK